MDKENKEAVADLIARKMIAPTEFATDLQKISRAAAAMASGRLKFATLVSLIAMDARVPKRTVEKVLVAAMDLESKHLAKKGSK